VVEARFNSTRNRSVKAEMNSRDLESNREDPSLAEFLEHRTHSFQKSVTDISIMIRKLNGESLVMGGTTCLG